MAQESKVRYFLAKLGTPSKNSQASRRLDAELVCINATNLSLFS